MAESGKRIGASDGSSQINTPDFLSNDVLLKPKLDSIFAEVESSLPNIDFEVSDLSSEEESPIFHRSLKTPTFDDDHLPSEDNLSDPFINSEQYVCQSKRLYSFIDEADFPSSETPDENYDEKHVPKQDQTNDAIDMDIALSRMGTELGIDLSDVLLHNASSRTSQTHTGSSGADLSETGKRSSRATGSKGVSSEPLDEKTIEIELNSPQTSPRSQKRREVPELSPSRNESENIESSLSLSMKNKHQTVIVREYEDSHTESVSDKPYTIRGKYSSENSEELVSQYFIKKPQLNLDSLDLDTILYGIVTGKKLPGDASEMSVKGNNEPTLIQKLAQASLGTTELRDVDPETGAVRKRRSAFKEAKTAKNEAFVRQASASTKVSSMGTNTGDLANLPMAELSPRRPITTPEKKTVFLDLRNFEAQKQAQKASVEKVQRILGIAAEPDSESSSDEEDEGGVVMWHEERRRIKESLSRTGTLPPSLLDAKQKKQPAKSFSSTVTTHTHAQRLEVRLDDAQKPRPVSAPSQMPQAGSEDADKSESTAEETKAEVSPVKTTAAEIDQIARQMAENKKKREQREAERQSRMRLGQRLEALRPTASSKGKQPPAEATHTLFDIESSYEPAPRTLSTLGTEDLVLLSVQLASAGEVAHKGAAHRHIDSGQGLSATYTCLLTWLLSLVPEDPSGDPGHGIPQSSDATLSSGLLMAPFAVLGLQQMFLQDQLVLYVAIRPNAHFTQDQLPEAVKKTKKREELRTLSPFQLLLTSFLSRNTLQTVCPWLADLVSMAVAAPGAPQPTGYCYRPPLPSVTTRPLASFIQFNTDPNAVKKIFELDVGFFWETVDNEEFVRDQDIGNNGMDYDTQNTMSLVYKKVFRDPRAMMGIFNRVLQEGMDFSGVRLLYPTAELMDIASGKHVTTNKDKQASKEILSNVGPVLAMALRATFARTLWIDAVGPSDPILARKTDPKSLCALFGGESREESLIFCPRHPARVNTELCRWFGGRVPRSGVINTGTGHSKSGKGKKKGGATEELPSVRPPACLTTMSRGQVFLTISPLLPTSCMGLLLSTCQRRGYQTRGIRRLRLSAKKASLLGIPTSKVPVFSVSGSLPTSPTSSLQSFDFPPPVAVSTSGGLVSGCARTLRPCTQLLLDKENTLHAAASLIEAFMVQMSLLNILGDIQKEVDGSLSSMDLFHITPYTDQLLVQIGGDFSKTPENELSTEHGYIAPALHSNPELEEVVVLTLTGHAFMKNFGLFLSRLQGVVPYGRGSGGGGLQPLTDGFELLGIKWLPSLSATHAKQLTPYEVGHRQWKPSIHTLTSEPAVVLVLRGVNAFRRVEAVIAQKPASAHAHAPGAATHPLDRLMSPTPELAFLQASMFFRDHELFADDAARPMLPYLPPPACCREVPELTTAVQKRPTRQTKVKDVLPAMQEESIFQTMQAGERPISTVLVAKPDVARRSLSRLLKRVAHEGFRVIAMRMLVLGEQERRHVVPLHDMENEVLAALHEQYLGGRASVALCLQRENAVKHLLDLLGPSDPRTAKKQSPFYWRGMFGTDPVANGLYCSKDYKTAVRDQKLFFSDGLSCQTNVDLRAEQIPAPGADSLADRHAAELRLIQAASVTGINPALVTSGMGDGELVVTSLTQTQCVLLTPLLLMSETGRPRSFPYVTVIDRLLSNGYELVGARMLWFTHAQAEHFLRLIDAGTFALVPYLTSGASFVLALQRDNAVIAFDTSLGSEFEKDSVHSRYNKQILRAKNNQQAKQLLSYFFDNLIPGAQLEITSTPK